MLLSRVIDVRTRLHFSSVRARREYSTKRSTERERERDLAQQNVKLSCKWLQSAAVILFEAKSVGGVQEINQWQIKFLVFICIFKKPMCQLLKQV